MSQLFDHFGARATLPGDTRAYYRLQALKEQGIGQIDRLPYSIKVLLESLSRDASIPARALEAAPAARPIALKLAAV